MQVGPWRYPVSSPLASPQQPRMRRTHNEATIGQCLEALMEQSGIALRLRASQAVAQWPRLVGAGGAAATLGFRYRKGVLRVRVTGAAWVQEMGLRRTELLAALNHHAGAPTFTGLEFHT